MNIVSNLKTWRNIRSQLHGKTIGFVPTMGNLHNGHLSLLQRAQVENDITVMSIFINPTQFNESSDYALYPRTLENDIELLSSKKNFIAPNSQTAQEGGSCLSSGNKGLSSDNHSGHSISTPLTLKLDYLLLPEPNEIYSDHYHVQLIETELSKELEGEFRPGHFSGMLTIVLKLLNLVQPTSAYFGEKDYQQLLLVKKMVDALFIPTHIIGCPTMRAPDGLALSSRNSRLTAQQRIHACHFPRLLQSSLSISSIIEELSLLNFKIDYIVEKWERRLGAVWLDDIRLIDNFLLRA